MTVSIELKDLFAGLTDTSQWLSTEITGLSLDSRKIANRDLFIAIKGQTVDGRQYISAALEAGAAAVVAEYPVSYKGSGKVYEVRELGKLAGVVADRFFHSPSRQLCMIGVTGTNGKTTCCHLCR